MDKYIVAFDENDAFNALSVWRGHPQIRESLERGHIFDTAEPAREALADLIERAKADGLCEPGHDCGRCMHWPPKVWRVQWSVTDVTDPEPAPDREAIEREGAYLNGITPS